jgi:hypothetical protein
MIKMVSVRTFTIYIFRSRLVFKKVKRMLLAPDISSNTKYNLKTN